MAKCPNGQMPKWPNARAQAERKKAKKKKVCVSLPRCESFLSLSLFLSLSFLLRFLQIICAVGFFYCFFKALRARVFFPIRGTTQREREFIYIHIHTHLARAVYIEREERCFLRVLHLVLLLREEEDGRPRCNDDSERRRINSRRLLRLLRIRRFLLHSSSL